MARRRPARGCSAPWQRQSRTTPRLPGRNLISSGAGGMNTRTISHASRFIHRFCPGKRPAGRAGASHRPGRAPRRAPRRGGQRGAGPARALSEPGMTATLHFQARHTSRVSAPAPPSPRGRSAFFPPAVADGRMSRFALRSRGEVAGRPPAALASTSPGASGPAAAGQEPYWGTTEIYEEGLTTEGSRVLFAWSYSPPKTTRLSGSPGGTLLSLEETLYYFPLKP